MGMLRIVLALAIVVTHVGEPLLGLTFFGGGVMAVESFFIISGFYMSLVLRTKYKTNIRDFYFNRFIRLFPLYWMFLFFAVLVYSSYWLIVGRPLGALSSFFTLEVQPIHLIWAFISNLTSLGIDAAILYANVTGIRVDGFIVIPAAWSLSVELAFYALAPWILRRNLLQQITLFSLFLGLRTFVFILVGYKWTPWNYFFMPTEMPFFLGGGLAYYLYESLENKQWFKYYSKYIGIILQTAIIISILLYNKSTIFELKDWLYYLIYALSLPFIFSASRKNQADRLIGEYSYPLYLIHVIVLSLWPPLRHFIPESIKIYFFLIISIAICTVAIEIDKKIQISLKRNINVNP